MSRQNDYSPNSDLPKCVLPGGGGACGGYARLSHAHERLERERETLRRALARSTRELVMLRDAEYETADTDDEGRCRKEEDAEAVAYLDSLIDEACKALGCEVGELAGIASEGRKS